MSVPSWRIAGGVLVVGDVMEDIIVVPEGEMVPGSDRRAEIEVLPGGSGANQAVWLAHYGVPAALAARVGGPDLVALRERFHRLGVTPLFAGDGDLATGRLVTLVAPGGERSFFTDRGANLAFDAADLPEDWCDGLGLLVISGYSLFEEGPRRAVRAMMDRAQDAGIPVAVDPASVGFLHEVGATHFLAWTHGADFLFANQDEAAFLSGTAVLGEQVATLGQSFGLVVVKRGAGGAAVGGRTGILAEVAGRRAAVRDSTGAGDAFLAGFVAGLRDAGDLDAALAAGNAAGAEAVSRLGGRPKG